MTENSTNIAKVQLFISCRKLKDVETFSKSDPFVEVFEKSRSGSWDKIGQTEVIWDNLNPDFIKNFTIDYYFEEQQYLRFDIFDANIRENKEVKGEPLGICECTLGEIVGAKGQQLIKSLRLPEEVKTIGNIILRVEEVSITCLDEIAIQFLGRNLDNTSCCYRCHPSKPMFYLSRIMENGTNQRVYLSEYTIGTNVTWKKIQKKVQDLCNGDLSRPIIFELYDHFTSGNHKPLGSFEFSLKKITEEGQKEFEIINPKKAKRKGYRNSGTIAISSVQMFKEYTFLDYIAGGCQINLLIAVDFTSSNGIPTSPNSLHYMNPQGYNQYQSALNAVSEILLNYDSDKLVPLYGFGGKINRQISHCFPLNFNTEDPSVYGIEGIMRAYNSALRAVELSGPTLFSQIISTAVIMAESAQVNQLNQQYFILLILTDGEIHDMKDTIDWIVRGSNSPLSLVIVGIGNEDFSKMDILDADDEPLIDSKGKKMARDIVQFVPYRNFGNSPAELTKEVLAEIPREIVNHFKIKGITPNEHIQASPFNYEKPSPTRLNDDPIEILYDPLSNIFETHALVDSEAFNYNDSNPPYAHTDNYYSCAPPSLRNN